MKTIIFPISNPEATRIFTGLQTIILTKQQPDFEAAKLKLCVESAVVGECEAVKVEEYRNHPGRVIVQKTRMGNDEFNKYTEGKPVWGITVTNHVRYPEPVPLESLGIHKPMDGWQLVEDAPEPIAEVVEPEVQAEPEPPAEITPAQEQPAPFAEDYQEPQPEPLPQAQEFQQDSRPPRRSYRKGRNYDRE